LRLLAGRLEDKETGMGLENRGVESKKRMTMHLANPVNFVKTFRINDTEDRI
jgi:hypothetical protein